MIEKAITYPSDFSSHRVEILPNQIDSSQKTSALVLHILLSIAYLTLFQFRSFCWSVTHLNSFKEMSQETSPLFKEDGSISVPEEYQASFDKLLNIYAQKNDLTHEEALNELKNEARKGYCYGSCATLRYLCQSQPDKPMGELMRELNNHHDLIIYYQLISQINDFLVTSFKEFHNKLNEIKKQNPTKSDDEINSLLRDIDDTKLKKNYFYGDYKNKCEDWRALFSTSPLKEIHVDKLAKKINKESGFRDQIFIIHLEDPVKGSSHSLFLRINTNQNSYNFYDSRRGLYEFSSKEKLIESFISYCKADFSSKKNIYIERYNT